MHWKVSFSDVDLPCFCERSLAADLGYWKWFSPWWKETEALHQGTAWSSPPAVASFSSSQSLTRCAPGTRSHHSYIASKAAVWTLGQGTNSLHQIKPCSSLCAAPCSNVGMDPLGETRRCAKEQELCSLAACVSHMCACMRVHVVR